MIRRRGVLALAPLLVLAAGPVAAAGGLELVMFERDGCPYCAQWHAEVGPAYPKSAEGRAAPLRRVNLRDPLPADLVLDRPAVISPTFVLAQGGVERGRIEGYPGAEFFWGLLGRMLAEAGTGAASGSAAGSAP